MSGKVLSEISTVTWVKLSGLKSSLPDISIGKNKMYLNIQSYLCSQDKHHILLANQENLTWNHRGQRKKNVLKSDSSGKTDDISTKGIN